MIDFEIVEGGKSKFITWSKALRVYRNKSLSTIYARTCKRENGIS
jgi:hypothetical protein